MKLPTIKNNTKETLHWQLSTGNFSGFTLIEMMISITLFAIVIIMAFDVMGNIGIMRTKVSSQLDLNNELYAVTERFVDLIKTGGDIDYEEYWNRKVVWINTSSGHYSVFSGFGNYGSGSTGYGDGLYSCVSWSGTNIIGTGGCLFWSTQKQRYGQYHQQFIDYNSNADGDKGDENGDGSIFGDDDDEDLGMGPSAFTGWVGMKELYLIKKGAKSERTYFRWALKADPSKPTEATCDFVTGTGTGCLGNIQVLRLVGKDLGLNHSGAVTSSGKYDGIVDTWECHPDYLCTGANNLPAGIDDGWVNVFPDWVHVKDVDFFPYPGKDFRYAWRESDSSIVLQPYVRLRITLGLAWEKRKKIRWPSGETTIMTTINLSR